MNREGTGEEEVLGECKRDVFRDAGVPFVVERMPAYLLSFAEATLQ